MAAREAGDAGSRGRAGAGAGARGLAGGGLAAGASGSRSGSRAGGGGVGAGAGQVVEGLGGEGLADHTEAGAGTVVLLDVPPGVVLSEELTADGVPVLLGVGDAGDGLALVVSADGPAGLGDPDLLAVGDGLGLSDGGVEQGLGVVDGVAVGGLVEGVGVEAEPVDLVDDSGVGGVGPGVPGVDVTDGGAAQLGAGDGRLDVLDAGDQVVRVHADASIGLSTSDRVTVEILATNGDTSDQLGEGLAVGADGGLEGSNLVVDVTAGGPETQQQSNLLLNGGLDSLDGGVGGTTLDHGVETSAGEGAVGVLQLLGVLELGDEVGLVASATILVGGAVVETLVSGLSCHDGHSQSENLLHLHDENVWKRMCD